MKNTFFSIMDFLLKHTGVQIYLASLLIVLLISFIIYKIRMRLIHRFFRENQYAIQIKKKRKVKTSNNESTTQEYLEWSYPKWKIRNENLILWNYNTAKSISDIEKDIPSIQNIFANYLYKKQILKASYAGSNKIIFYTKDRTLEKPYKEILKPTDPIFIGKDLLTKEKISWERIQDFNSVLMCGLPFSGKSFLGEKIIQQLTHKNIEVVIISTKAHVDFKQKNVKKFDVSVPSERSDLLAMIQQELEHYVILKKEIANSKYSKLKDLNSSNQKVFVIDELWNIETYLESKNEKKLLQSFLESLIREYRYLSRCVVFISQSPKVSEGANISIRMCSIIISGKLDTKEISESVFGTSIAYDSELKQGELVFWDRNSSPRIIKVPSEIQYG